MKIFKGLENIHAVIDRHEIEWRREQGEQVEDLPEFNAEEAVRRRLTKSAQEGSGRFSADRFLGSSSKKKKGKKENPEIISVIKQKDDKPHSWLYNEVLKAVQAASDGGKTKVVAIFIPVIQNGKEFEDLPVDVSVTLPPVSEEEIKIAPELFEEINEAPAQEQEEAEAEAPIEEVAEEISVSEPEQPNFEEVETETQVEDFNLLPESQDKPDEELAEAFNTIEEKLDSSLEEAKSEESEETFPEISTDIEEPEEPENIPVEENENESENNESGVLEVPASEVLDFAEFPVITTEESEEPVEFEDVIEEITPEQEPQEQEQESGETTIEEEPENDIAPLEEFDTDDIFEDSEAVEKLNEVPDEESEEQNNDEEEENISLEVSN